MHGKQPSLSRSGWFAIAVGTVGFACYVATGLFRMSSRLPYASATTLGYERWLQLDNGALCYWSFDEVELNRVKGEGRVGVAPPSWSNLHTGWGPWSLWPHWEAWPTPKTGVIYVIPLWPVLVAVVMPGMVVGLRNLRERRRWRLHSCPSCGYDHRGLAADAKCPECGTAPGAGSFRCGGG